MIGGLADMGRRNPTRDEEPGVSKAALGVQQRFATSLVAVAIFLNVDLGHAGFFAPVGGAVDAGIASEVFTNILRGKESGEAVNCAVLFGQGPHFRR
jgi:hypothetical protein